MTTVLMALALVALATAGWLALDLLYAWWRK